MAIQHAPGRDAWLREDARGCRGRSGGGAAGAGRRRLVRTGPPRVPWWQSEWDGVAAAVELPGAASRSAHHGCCPMACLARPASPASIHQGPRAVRQALRMGPSHPRCRAGHPVASAGSARRDRGPKPARRCARGPRRAPRRSPCAPMSGDGAWGSRAPTRRPQRIRRPTETPQRDVDRPQQQRQNQQHRPEVGRT